KRIADRSLQRGDTSLTEGHIRTAQNCWLRAAGYYRQAEFWLAADDPRRLAIFEKMETCSKKFLSWLVPAGQPVDIPYENGAALCGYFVRAPFAIERQPVLISMGGLDSIKDEMWAMQAHGALQRGISVLMIDGPGQGGTLRRHRVATRYDYEVPVGRCLDYLATRDDGHALAGHIKWVFGAKTMAEAAEVARPFKLEGALDHMRCPYLIIHGGHDVLGVEAVNTVYDYARSK